MLIFIPTVEKKCALVELVRAVDPAFWGEYQSVVNEIETIVSVASDSKRKIGDDEWLEIEKIGRRLQNLLREI